MPALKKFKYLVFSVLLILPLFTGACSSIGGDEIVIRVSNWEEYIDLGGWDEDEAIELSDDTVIIGENSLVDDFEDWYFETYGRRVRVEYSTFGTNEELYNQMSIGDSFDLVCPSEYMIMKMYREGMLIPYSDEFFDESIPENYYTNGISPYIEDVFDSLDMGGDPLSKYTAGYMWGTLGLLYNPEYVSEEDASHWDILLNDKYKKRVTIKDSVRDAYFAAISIANYDLITSEEFLNAPDYHERLSEVLNATDPDTIARVDEVLSRIKENVYSFEVDSGKADTITGKVIANQQWSGDGVYSMDLADEEDVELSYSAPIEGTNLWFDGWIMLKDGIAGNSDRQHAAEAFVNFLSRPDNVVRNMYYIGYTSVISGGDDETILDYADYLFGAEEDEDETAEYPLGYFFAYGDEASYDDYLITTTPDQTTRQLYAQYPPEEVVNRSVVMRCFSDEANEAISRMWIEVRCFSF